MQMMGFSFPPDKFKTRDTLEQLPFEYIVRIRDMFKHEYGFWLKWLEERADSVVFSICQVCDEEGIGFDSIPDDWGWLELKNGDGHMLMCDKCQFRYAEKFNELPNIVKEI